MVDTHAPVLVMASSLAVGAGGIELEVLTRGVAARLVLAFLGDGLLCAFGLATELADPEGSDELEVVGLGVGAEAVLARVIQLLMEPVDVYLHGLVGR